MCLTSKEIVLLALFAGIAYVSCDGRETPGPSLPLNQAVTQKVNELNPSLKTEVNSNSSCTDGNCTDTAAKGTHGMFSFDFDNNKDMLMRTFYVLIGLTAVIVVYFVVRTIRSRRRRNRTKRYGLLATKDDQLEMAPLDMDDEEEDLTVFDINNHHAK